MKCPNIDLNWNPLLKNYGHWNAVIIDITAKAHSTSTCTWKILMILNANLQLFIFSIIVLSSIWFGCVLKFETNTFTCGKIHCPNNLETLVFIYILCMYIIIFFYLVCYFSRLFLVLLIIICLCLLLEHRDGRIERLSGTFDFKHMKKHRLFIFLLVWHD